MSLASVLLYLVYILSCPVNFVLYSNRFYHSNDVNYTLGLSKGCASVLL